MNYKNKNSYFEIQRDWPEQYASVTIHKNPSAKVSHLDVYKGKCGPEYLTNFKMTEFSPGQIPDMLPNNLGWPIMSPRCCKHFGEIDADVKATLHPIESLLIPSCPDLSGYCLLSASLVLDCLDLDSDGIDWDDESRDLVSSFDKLQFMASRIPKRVSFFGVKRVPVVHIVSGELQKALAADRPEGIMFEVCEVLDDVNS